VISKGRNLADDGTCNLTAQGDKPNTEPLLRPLANYGGPTKTFALPKTSPAIDAGLADTTQTDQRGLPRKVDYPGCQRPWAVTTPTSGRSSCSRPEDSKPPGCGSSASSKPWPQPGPLKSRASGVGSA
jgi:hypothetical protein